MRVDADGVIEELIAEAVDFPESANQKIAIAGIPNSHSHAFQFLMAGLAEHRTHATDTFWTWRDLMYRCANLIEPEDLYCIAAQLYQTMLQCGYTSVAEFHYLHHPLRNPNQGNHLSMSEALLKAAEDTGIGITLLPTLYQTADFDGRALTSEQRRFFHQTEQYLQLTQDLASLCRKQANANLGMALHSLRAVPEEAIGPVLAELAKLPSNTPLHLHISEQQKEVAACLEHRGQRPVAWLLDHLPVDERWCLVHATHLNPEECSALAQSRAVVSLCPTTEANLGDGLFPLAPFRAYNGRITIGSDSNICTNPFEELRWLEYGQRLISQQRNLGADALQPHTGSALYQACLQGGAQALGQPIGALGLGQRADLLVLNANDPLFTQRPPQFWLDALVFAGGPAQIDEVWVAGRACIKQQQHAKAEKFESEFRRTLEKLIPKLIDSTG